MTRRPQPAERKLVTLLFADLTGFTALCETLDPEDVTEFLLPAMSQLGAVVESFGGTVVQFSGDGFFAAFGAPAAYEDHAERAVRAALAVRDRARELGRAGSLRLPDVHAGVDTGEVFVAPSDDRAGFTLYGDAVNVASRLCSAARSGSVLVGPQARTLAGDSIVYGPLRRRRIKGKSEPMVVAQAMGVRGDPGPRIGAASAVFVGRDGALSFLQERLAETARSGRSGVVLVTGDAGIGKSRLASEFRARCGADVLAGRCSPYGARLPLAALAGAIADRTGAKPGRGAGKAVTAFAATLASGPATKTLARKIALLCGIDEPDRATLPVADAVSVARDVLESLARRSPVLVLLDDVHWADQDLSHLLASIAAEPWSAPVLFAGFSRPDPARFPAGADLLALDVLPDDGMRVIINDRLQPSVDRSVADRLILQAGGNPLFLEESLAMLLESGALRIDGDRWRVADAGAFDRVPVTLRSLITARIDGLDAGSKRVLQAAATCGRVTWDLLLRELDGEDPDAPARLEDRGLLRRRPHSRIDGAVEYEFKHILIRDVAERSVPRRRRAVLHARIADWLCKVFTGRTGEPVDLIAHQYEQAWRLGGNSDLAPRAVEYLTRSGDQAFRHQARLAGSIYGRAVEIAAAARVSPDLHADAVAGLAEAHLEQGRHAQARACASRARTLAARAGRSDIVARALMTQGGSHSDVGQVRQARALLEQARAMFGESGDRRGEAAALLRLAPTYRLNQMTQCILVLEESRVAAVAAGDHWIRAQAAQDLAYLLSAVGGREFRARFGEATRLIGDDANVRLRASLLRTAAYRSLLSGNFADAAQQSRRAHELAAEAGALSIQADSLLVESFALTATGPPQPAVEAGRRIRPLAAKLGSPGLRALALITEVRPALRLGRPAFAASRIAAARTILTAHQPIQLVEADLAEASLALERAAWRSVHPHANHAARRASAIGFTAYAAMGPLASGRAFLGAADYKRAIAALQKAAHLAGRADAYGSAALARACIRQARLLTAGPTPGNQAERGTGGDACELEAVGAENRGLLAARAGQTREAATGFADAVAAWRTLGTTAWLARALVFEASVRPDASPALLNEAREVLAAVRAPAEARRALLKAGPW